MDTLETTAMVDHEDRHWWYRGRRRIVHDELARIALPRDARILDAGCGSGRLLDTLSEYGSVSAIDMSDYNVGLSRRRGHEDVHQAVVEDLPFEDETFDLITSLDVLEHTLDDRVALRELLRVTKPGGHLLATVPTYQALWSNHDVLNHHHRRYNRAMMADSAGAAGWTVQRMTFFNSFLLPPAAGVRMFQKLRREPIEHHRSDVDIGPEWLYPVLEMPMKAEAAWLRGNRTLPMGLSLLAVMRR
jgi:SAM-dependent methyltransferase